MSLDACADLVARGDADRFASVLAAPKPARAILLPIYAFNVEVTRAPWVTGEAGIAEIRLQWWRDALAEIAEGRAVRRTEVTEPLAAVLDVQGAELLDALVAARRWDIYAQPFDDMAALTDYVDATGGTLMWVAARALCTPVAAESPVRALGRAAGLAAFLRAVPALVAAGRQPLSTGDPEALRNLARTGLGDLATARAARLPRVAIPALLAGWRAGPTLRAALADPSRIAAGRLQGTEAARRWGLLWRSVSGRP